MKKMDLSKPNSYPDNKFRFVEGIENIMGKGKMLVPTIFTFSHVFNSPNPNGRLTKDFDVWGQRFCLNLFLTVHICTSLTFSVSTIFPGSR